MSRKINGEDIYHSQRNNALVEIFQDYIFRAIENMRKEATEETRKIIQEVRSKICLHVSCFPTSFIDGAHSCGWPMSVFAPGIQPEDSVMCIMNNPNNAKLFHKIRFVPETWGYNEIPDYYPVLGEIIWGQKMCKYETRMPFEKYYNYIDNGCCIVYAHPGHVIVGKGYDEEKKARIYNDPFVGPKLEEPGTTLGWGVVIYPYTGNSK